MDDVIDPFELAAKPRTEWQPAIRAILRTLDKAKQSKEPLPRWLDGYDKLIGDATGDQRVVKLESVLAVFDSEENRQQQTRMEDGRRKRATADAEADRRRAAAEARRAQDDFDSQAAAGTALVRRPSPLPPARIPHDASAQGLRKRPISQAGDTSSGILTCPNCKSPLFRAKRSFGGKAGFATTGLALAGPIGLAGGLLARKKHVKCEACGKTFLRR